jgi:hypothetical protein
LGSSAPTRSSLSLDPLAVPAFKRANQEAAPTPQKKYTKRATIRPAVLNMIEEPSQLVESVSRLRKINFFNYLNKTLQLLVNTKSSNYKELQHGQVSSGKPVIS